MSRRVKTETRKVEIARAVLELLGETPLETLTTRQIAKELQLSQPALFRHFRTREAIVLAAIDEGRAELGAVASAALTGAPGPIGRLSSLAAGLLAHIDKRPGLARLLFSWPGPGAVRTALMQLVSMQTSLVAELVGEAQHCGQVSSAADPAAAASAFVGLVQATVLRNQLYERDASPGEDARALVALWLHGVAARGADGELAAAPTAPTAPSALRRDVAVSVGEPLLALDARPILASGRDPLADILGQLDQLRSGGVLCVSAPFEPRPLLTLLKERGHATRVRNLDGCWAVDIVCDGASEILDLTQLEPPLPLEFVLRAEADLESGAIFIAHVPRTPTLLLPHLRNRGAAWQIHPYADCTALICLWHEA